MTNKLFIGSLAYSINDTQLQEFFSQVGTVISAKVITDRYSGQSKGFGFVEMSTEEEAKKAMEELDGKPLAGRNILVKEAIPQENKPRNFDQKKPYNKDYKNRNSYTKKNRW